MKNFFYKVIAYLFCCSSNEHSTAKFPIWNNEMAKFVADPVAEAKFEPEFFFATCSKISQPLSIKCDAHWMIYNKATSQADTTFELLGGENLYKDKDLQIISIQHHTIRSGIIVKWLETQNDLILRAGVTLRHWDHKSIEVSHPVNLPKDDPTFVFEYFSNWETGVGIILTSASACGRRPGKCIFRYDYDLKPVGKSNPTPFDLNLTNLVIQSKTGGSHFAYGKNPVTGAYDLVHIDPDDGTRKLHIFESKVQFVRSRGSNFILCDSDSSVIHCRRFFDNGKADQNITIQSSLPTKLISVLDIAAGDAALLISEKVECQGEDCKDVFLTIIQERVPLRTYVVRPDCSGDKKNIVFVGFGMTTHVLVTHGCERIDAKDNSKSQYNLQQVRIGEEGQEVSLDLFTSV